MANAAPFYTICVGSCVGIAVVYFILLRLLTGPTVFISIIGTQGALIYHLNYITVVYNGLKEPAIRKYSRPYIDFIWFVTITFGVFTLLSVVRIRHSLVLTKQVTKLLIENLLRCLVI